MYLQTRRLVLKSFSEKDDVALGSLLQNEQIGKTYMLPDFENEQQCMGLVRRLRELSLDKSRCVAGIYLGDALIGFLNDVEITNGSVELGYVIDPDHWNRGYATEALIAVSEYLLRQGFQEVVTGAFAENAASIRVMEKTGMIRLERADSVEYRGRVHRCVYYAVQR